MNRGNSLIVSLQISCVLGLSRSHHGHKPDPLDYRSAPTEVSPYSAASISFYCLVSKCKNYLVYLCLLGFFPTRLNEVVEKTILFKTLILRTKENKSKVILQIFTNAAFYLCLQYLKQITFFA